MNEKTRWKSLGVSLVLAVSVPLCGALIGGCGESEESATPGPTAVPGTTEIPTTAPGSTPQPGMPPAGGADAVDKAAGVTLAK